MLFYFVAYGSKNTITVIDLQDTVSYQREDWATVNSKNFYSAAEAIAYARDLAERHGLEYELFDSRYGVDSETLELE